MKYSFGLPSIAVALALALVLSVPVAVAPAFAKESSDSGRAVVLTEGTSFAAAVSPDGKWVAFDLHGRIWLVSRRSGETRQISPGFDDARLPAWSPDGRKLAYQRYHKGNWHIWSIDVQSGTADPITEGDSDNRDPTWSPDGSFVYFSSDRERHYGLWRKNVASGVVEKALDYEGNATSPAVASDGSIAFIGRLAGRGQATRIMLKKAGAAPAVIYEAKDKFLAGLSWIGEGRLGLVSFDNEWCSQKVELLAIDAATGKAEPLTAADEDVFPFRASADRNGRVVYASDGKIRVLGGKGRDAVVPFRARVAISEPKFAHMEYDFSRSRSFVAKGIVDPAIAPAGDGIAFAALGDLWTARPGQAPRRITDDKYVDLAPVYSPDGKQLAWLSDRNGRMQIWLRDVATGSERHLETPGDASNVSWKPDGQTLTFSFEQGRTSGLSSIAVGTGKVVQLASGASANGRASWSADGRFYATLKFDIGPTLFREGRNVLSIVDAASGKGTTIQPLPGMLFGAREQLSTQWSPDGRNVAAIMNRDAWLFPINDQGAVAGTPRKVASDVDGSLSWTGDSRHILVQSGTRLTRIAIDGSAQLDMTPRIEARASAGTGRKILRAGRLFDGESENYLQNVDILIEDNRIVAVVPAGNEQSRGFGGSLIDVSDKVALPGLMDLHAHINSKSGTRPALALLAYGITTIRSPASDPYASLDYREALATGRRVGPRLFFSGFPIEGNRIFYPHMRSYATDAGLAHDLQIAKDLDYDLIKTYVRLENDVQEQVIDFAAKNNLYVVSHEFLPAGALGAGGKEHLKGTSRDRFGSALSLRSRIYSDIPAVSSSTGMRITPTLAITLGLAQELRTKPQNFDDWRFKELLGEDEVARHLGFLKGIPGSAEEMTRSVDEFSVSLRKIVEGGGHIVAGTDCPLVPCGISLFNEIDIAAGPGGLPPYQAIQYATAWSADAMGLGKELGRIKPGMLADIIIVDGDPLSRTSDLRRLEAVMIDGDYHPLGSPEFRSPFVN